LKDWNLEKNLDAMFNDMNSIVTTKLGGEQVQLRGGGICFAAVRDDTI
jgi:hypothetical protein